MSFVDLATLALHRRSEMEIRISTLAAKCDQAINDIRKLKSQARTFVERLNCDPSELKERFLTCMFQLDEYIYLMTDFNLSIAKLAEENGSVDMAPVQDRSYVPYPVMTPTNLMDVLSEPTPSTSAACQNMCPYVDKPRRRRIPRKEQLLIAFSSSSCSSESVPEVKHCVEKETQCVAEEIKDLTINDPPAAVEPMNLPAQPILQIDHVYNATMMEISGPSIWIVTADTTELYNLCREMTEFYKENKVEMTMEDIGNLSCCVCYDNESDFYYRALFLRIKEDDISPVEVFLVDTGEIRSVSLEHIQRIVARFCAKPPYAYCCHLADVELISNNKDLTKKQEEFIKEYLGIQYSIRVDDNTSESLGVYVLLDDTTTLNKLLVEEGLAFAIDKMAPEPEPKPKPARLMEGPPELSRAASELDMECPEFEDPVQAVTGYSNRDEIDICKHYKGGAEKSCFKGARCKKRHVLKHPDGWTLDRVSVPTTVGTLPLPAPGSFLRVLVTYVCHFDRVCVQFVSGRPRGNMPRFGVVLPPTTLEGLVQDMNSPATRMAYKKLAIAPAPGELVAALYPLDDLWYRARVLSCTIVDQSVEIMYIDYGNVVWVKENAVRELQPRFLSLPAQAVRCRLAGVVPNSQDSKQWAKAKAVLAEITQDKQMNARVIERGFDELTVELFDSQGYSVAERMEARGVVALKEIEVETDIDVKIKMMQA